MKQTLLVTSDFYPRVGGVAKYYTKLCEGLPADKMVVLNVGAEQSSALSAFKYIHLKKQWRRILPHWLQAIWFIWRTVKKYNIEIVWVGNILPFGTATFVLKNFGLIKEYVVSIHGLDVNLAFQDKPRLTQRILENAKYITANSKFTKGLVVEKGIEEEKIKVVYPGVDVVTNNISHGVRANGHSPVLLTVARLVKRKGIDDVIRAMPEVWKKYPALTYNIVGEGPERENLEALACETVGANGHSPIQDRIRFLGELSGDELEKAYHKADIFIMTPKQLGPDVEGFGIVYLEANAHGLPVIASRTGGVPEAVHDGVNGLLVESGNIEEIGAALMRVCSDRKMREQLSEKGLARAHEFDWSSSVTTLTQLLT